MQSLFNNGYNYVYNQYGMAGLIAIGIGVVVLFVMIFILLDRRR